MVSRATEVDIAVHALNRVSELGRLNTAASPDLKRGWGYCACSLHLCNTLAQPHDPRSQARLRPPLNHVDQGLCCLHSPPCTNAPSSLKPLGKADSGRLDIRSWTTCSADTMSRAK